MDSHGFTVPTKNLREISNGGKGHFDFDKRYFRY